MTQKICLSYLAEIFDGIHQAGDTYKIALYTSSASLDGSTTAYSATNEVSGAGYTAGGMALTGRSVNSGSGKAWVDFDDPVWTASTITARGALIYNSTRSNKAVMVIDFGADKTDTAGNFTLTLPAADAADALLRLAN